MIKLIPSNILKTAKTHLHFCRQLHFLKITQQTLDVLITCKIQLIFAIVGSEIILTDKRNKIACIYDMFRFFRS